MLGFLLFLVEIDNLSVVAIVAVVQIIHFVKCILFCNRVFLVFAKGVHKCFL